MNTSAPRNHVRREHRKRSGKFTQELEETHALFLISVSANRPGLDIAKVATGEIWYGRKAIDVGLVDELQTSDAFAGTTGGLGTYSRSGSCTRKPGRKNWLAAEGAMEKPSSRYGRKG